MSTSSIALLAASTSAFIAAAAAAKTWAVSAGSIPWLTATLLLYTVGNLIIMKIIRDIGMSSALSLSAVVQLLAVNAIAVAVFGEKISGRQALGIALAAASILLIAMDSRSR